MARIAVVGAGQSGGQLALGLLQTGHEVTLINDRSPAEIRSGPVLSSQCMFGSALATEEELGLDFWTDACPPIGSIEMSLETADPITWSARFDVPARAVDQRIKCAAWAEEVAMRGGTLIIQTVGVPELEEYARTHDLVVVATGRGDVGRMFRPDHGRSPFDRPQRAIALTYVRGMAPASGEPGIRYRAIPEVGEFFTFPALTTGGPCDIWVFEGVPSGPMDCWDDVRSPAEHLKRSLQVLAKFFPSDFERCADVILTDDGGVLRGRFTPQVRRPVATLPSGQVIIGMGDSVVLNDPISGQGANLAAHAAAHYLDSINHNGSAKFDEKWMTGTFEKFWRGWAQWAVEWTNSMLRGPADHHPALFADASGNPELAAALASGFNDPRELFQWWFDAPAAERFRAEKKAAQRGRFDLRDLRSALGQYATGVAVITARGTDGRRVGMTANSFTSVSMDPPLVLWCPGKNAPSLPTFTEATHFAVNVLGAGHEHISRQFSTPAVDKFFEIDLIDGKGGTPILPGAIASFECRTVRCVEVGDHIMIIGEIEHFAATKGDPLVFHAGSFHAGL